jgi:TRAP-type C4-dicarboxylate transport system permease small subunit
MSKVAWPRPARYKAAFKAKCYPGDAVHADHQTACREGAGVTAAIPPDTFAAASPLPITGVLGAVQRILDGINLLMAIGSAIAILIAGVVLTWEVAGRYFLGTASDWQDELSVFLLIGATFASAAWTQARRGHVGIEALGHILPPRINRVRCFVADLIAFLFCAFFAWKCQALLTEAWEEGQTTTSAWGPPLWIPYVCMTFGMMLLSVQLLMQTLQLGRRA